MVTEDVDVCAPMTGQNVERILEAFAGLDPRFRMSPGRPPLPTDPAKLGGFKDLYIMTSLGQVDLLSEITGLGEYEAVAGQSTLIDVAGETFRVLAIEALIQSKLALGRPKDLHVAAELSAIRDRMRGEA